MKRLMSDDYMIDLRKDLKFAMNSYRFFNNQECQYFPCHKVEKKETFNCLFCYCPLYLLDECGGNYKINKNIKDCSNCMIPHRPKGYDYINKKLLEVFEEKNKAYKEQS